MQNFFQLLTKGKIWKIFWIKRTSVRLNTANHEDINTILMLCYFFQKFSLEKQKQIEKY